MLLELPEDIVMFGTEAVLGFDINVAERHVSGLARAGQYFTAEQGSRGEAAPAVKFSEEVLLQLPNEGRDFLGSHLAAGSGC